MSKWGDWKQHPTMMVVWKNYMFMCSYDDPTLPAATVIKPIEKDYSLAFIIAFLIFLYTYKVIGSSYEFSSYEPCEVSCGFAFEVTVDDSGREISKNFSFNEPGISHNYQAGAIVISHEEDWCSEEGAYTTTGMSPEGEKISCSNDAQSRNDVWFKFQASSDQVELEVNQTGASPTEQSWI